MLDDYTSQGFLRRWTILDGHARCPHNAVNPWQISDADVAEILAQNAAARAKIDAVEEYEAALMIRSGEAPDRYEDVLDEDGETITRRETLAYKGWRAAGQAVSDVAPDIAALADIRSRKPVLDENGQEIEREPDPIPEDTLTTWDPVPKSVPAFQGRIVLRAAGIYDAAVAAINSMTDPMQRAVALEGFEGANDWARNSPMIAAMSAALNLNKEQVNALFRQAVTIIV